MQYFKKGTLVFVRTQSYPPWPAQVERKYDNGLYKVNFIGQKSYTRIERDKMDLFSEQRAKQIHSQLQDKKLSKAIFVALKQFQNRKKKGQIDPDLAQLLKKPLPPLILSMYKDAAKLEINFKSPHVAHFAPYSLAKYSPSNSTEDNLQEVGKILDRIYEFIILPVQQKLPQFMEQSQYVDKKQKMDQQIYKLKQLLLKEQQNFKPLHEPIKERSQKQPIARGLSNTPQPFSMHPASRGHMQSQNHTKLFFMQKLIDTKIVQRLIMTIKAYESFREQSQKQFEEVINFLRQKFNTFYDKFRQEYNKKKIPSQKDRIMLQKFQNFQAYL